MKNTTLLIALTIFVGLSYLPDVDALPVLGENVTPFVDEGPVWADNDPVRIKIDPTLNGSEVPLNFTLDLWFQNFSYEPQESTSLPTQYANGKKRPQAGHFHVYGTLMDDNSLDPASPDFWNYTNVFLGAPAATLVEPGHVQFDINLPVEGTYQLRVETQYDDHTFRVAPHPQNWNATESIYVTAIPEPGTMALLTLGGVLLLRRRR